MLAYVVFVFSNPVQKINWIDYFKSVKTGIALHQNLLPPVKAVSYNPVPIRSFEGIDLNTEGNGDVGKQMKAGAENSNFFILYNELTGRKISVMAMTILGFSACAVILLPLLLVRKKKLPFSTLQLLLLGFLIYNTYEFFTPVHRLAYHWVQFLFPLLLTVLFVKRLYVIPVVFLTAGFYLNMAVLPSVKMEHSIGEFLIVVAMLYLVYRELIKQYVNEDRLRVNRSIYIA